MLRSWWATVSGAQVALVFLFVAGQVERLEEQVRQLAGQYARDQKQLAEQVESLTENMLRLGAHVTVLTNAYERANASHNALVRDLDELFR